MDGYQNSQQVCASPDHQTYTDGITVTSRMKENSPLMFPPLRVFLFLFFGFRVYYS